MEPWIILLRFKYNRAVARFKNFTNIIPHQLLPQGCHFAFKKIQIKFSAQYFIQALKGLHCSFETTIIYFIYFLVASPVYSLVYLFIYFIYFFFYVVILVRFRALDIALTDPGC